MTSDERESWPSQAVQQDGLANRLELRGVEPLTFNPSKLPEHEEKN
jgi:hypothetical protein